MLNPYKTKLEIADIAMVCKNKKVMTHSFGGFLQQVEFVCESMGSINIL